MATQDGRELDREARAHMELAVLLRKERPPAKSDQVRRILQSNLTTSRIVDAIRQVDLDSPEKPAGAEKAAAPERAAVTEEPQRGQEQESSTAEEGPEDHESPSRRNGGRRLSRLPNPLRLGLPKLKSVIKVPRVATPFFRYLFREFSRIADFGHATHVFSPVFLLPILRVESGVARFFSDSLTPWANELISLLAPSLVVGWKHLTKRQYNMLVALDRLCREITTTNLHLLNLRDRNVVDKLRTLETLFFAFHYQRESVGEAVEAIGEAMSKEAELASKADRAELLANRILTPDYTIPSLYNVLLGLNMLKHHAALSLQELLTPELGEIFEIEIYACDPEVETKIEALIDELKTKVAKLHRNWSQLKRFKDLVNLPEVNPPEYPEMTTVYQITSSTLKPRSFAEDRDNVMEFAPHFFRRFESCCTPLLGGSVRLEGNGRIEVFVPRAFQNELDRLRLTASKLERSAFGFRSFPYLRYVTIKREGKGGVAPELEVIGLLDDAAAALVNIARKLERVLAVSSLNGQNTSTPTSGRPQSAVDPAAAVAGRTITLPHRSAVIAQGSWLAGKSVSEAVTTVATVCFQSAVYLYDTSFLETLSSERVLRQRIESHLETLRRISDPSSYDQLVGILLKDS